MNNKKKRKKWVIFATVASLITGAAAAALFISFPYSKGTAQQLTRGHDAAPTHVGKDRFAYDFAGAGCDSWNSPVLAVKDGVVTRVDIGHMHGETNSYGNQVVIDHGDGYTSRYAHLEQVFVSTTHKVQEGDAIGTQGNTGSVVGSACLTYPGTHLHFAMYKDGTPYKPEKIGGYDELVVGQEYISQTEIHIEKESFISFPLEERENKTWWQKIKEVVGSVFSFFKKDDAFEKPEEKGKGDKGEKPEEANEALEVENTIVLIPSSTITTSITIAKVSSTATSRITTTSTTEKTHTALDGNEAQIAQDDVEGIKIDDYDEEKNPKEWFYKKNRSHEIKKNGNSGGRGRGGVMYEVEEDHDIDESPGVITVATTTSSTITTVSTSTEEETPEAHDALDAADVESIPSVVINEINWMGTSGIINASVRCPEHEWIELYNNTTGTIDFAGWRLLIDDQEILLTGSIASHGYYLLAKRHARRNALVNIEINQLMQGVSIPDSGGTIQLINARGESVDVVSFEHGWPAGTLNGEAKGLYQPMARIDTTTSASLSNWKTDSAIRQGPQSNNCGELYGSPGDGNSGKWLLKDPAYYYADYVVSNTLRLAKEHNPYVLFTPTHIPEDITLIIEEGVVLVGSHPDAYLDVSGRLEIYGTQEHPVIFTSARDREYSNITVPLLEGDSPQPGDWSRIQMNPGASAYIEHAHFFYAGSRFLIERDGFFLRHDGAQVLRIVGANALLNNILIKHAASTEHDIEFVSTLWIEDSDVEIDGLVVQDSQEPSVAVTAINSTVVMDNIDISEEEIRVIGPTTSIQALL